MYTLRSVLPRAEKAFKNKQQAKNFEANGLGQIYKQLLDDLPVLNQAMKTGLSIHVVHNKWRKALGWSFGLECRYEDAIEYQKTCLTYSRFMAAAYGSHLLNIKTRATQLLQTVNTADQWRGRKKLVWALSFFIGIVIAVESWIYTYGTLGQPGTKQLQSYQKKLMKARSLEMPVYKE